MTRTSSLCVPFFPLCARRTWAHTYAFHILSRATPLPRGTTPVPGSSGPRPYLHHRTSARQCKGRSGGRVHDRSCEGDLANRGDGGGQPLKLQISRRPRGNPLRTSPFRLLPHILSEDLRGGIRRANPFTARDRIRFSLRRSSSSGPAISGPAARDSRVVPS
jgi:hypothetical protein